MPTLININYGLRAGLETAWLVNDIKLADAKNVTALLDDTSSATGISIQETSAAALVDNSYSGTVPPEPNPSDYGLNALLCGVRATATSDLAIQLTLTGFSPNQGVIVEIIAYNPSSRDRNVTVDGVTLLYDVLATTLPITDPVIFNANADGSGNLVVDIAKPAHADFYPNVNAMRIILPDTTDTVTPTDTDYTYGDTITLSSTITGLTSATLTDSLGNVLNLTGVTDTSVVIPALSGGLAGIILENGVVLEVSDGTDTASAAVNFVAPTGYTLTTLASVLPFSVESDWTFGFDTPAVIGDQSLENAAFATHNADGTSTITADGTYTYYTIQASTGDVSEIVKTVAAGAADTTIPVITADGSPTTFRDVGGVAPTFIVTALDDVDGDITGSLVESGDTVDVNTVGTYIRRWNVSDAAGNAATEVIRTIIIREPIISTDYIKPIVTSIQSTIVNQTINYKA